MRYLPFVAALLLASAGTVLANGMHVAPVKTGTIVWQLTKPGILQLGCLVSGRFEAGMIAKVEVVK